MLSKKTLLAAGVATAALISAGAAFAQSTSMTEQNHHRHGATSLIREEMSAGRIDQREGNYLIQKIREARQERHAERQSGQQQQSAPSQTYGQQYR
jgi:hypothetical protein